MRPAREQRHDGKILYVICHGAMGMLQIDRTLVIMIPDLGSTHTYKAGTWLAESNIEKGALHVLENVAGGDGNVPNLLGRAQGPSPSAPPPFATFILPRPIKVHQLFPLVLSKDAFTLISGSNPLSSDLVVDFLLILEYRYKELPRLGNIWPVAGDDLKVLAENPLTLHIYAEEEVPIDDGHAETAFNRTCQLLGLNIELLPQADHQVHHIVPEPMTLTSSIPLGLENRCFEFQPLAERRASLLEIAKAKETGLSLPDPWASLPCDDLKTLGRLFFGITKDHFPVGNASCLSVSIGTGF